MVPAPSYAVCLVPKSNRSVLVPRLVAVWECKIIVIDHVYNKLAELSDIAEERNQGRECMFNVSWINEFQGSQSVYMVYIVLHSQSLHSSLRG